MLLPIYLRNKKNPVKINFTGYDKINILYKEDIEHIAVLWILYLKLDYHPSYCHIIANI